MSNIIVVSGTLNNYNFCIIKDKYPKIIIEKIKKYFIVSPEENYDNKIIKFNIYYEDDKYLVIPKFFSIKTIDISQTKISKNGEINEIDIIKFECKKVSYCPKSINIKFINPKSPNKPLRDYQQKCINYILKLFNDSKDTHPKGGILNFACGMGKTIMAIYLASMLQLKTLIIVHQEFLQDQWIDRIKEYTNATVGIIRQKKCELDKDICIGMLHTICGKDDYDGDKFKDIGLVIYDEVHHLGSEFFSKVLMKTSAKYTIGLSATPIRSDNMMYIINWFIGDIIYKMKKDFDYRVLIKRIYFNSRDILFLEKLKKYNGRMTPDNIKMKTNLMNIRSRNNLIVNIINKLKTIGRKIFVFSERVDHLKLLKNDVDEQIKNNKEEHIYTTCFYMGSSKKSERKMAEKSGDIIFATLKLAEEGLDISRLDTIIYALPLKQEKQLTQSAGRILRLEKFDDLINVPLIIDISDELSNFKKWTIDRNYVYKKENFYVQDFYYSDNDYSYKNTDEVNKDPMDIIFGDLDDEEFIENNLIVKKDEKNINIFNNIKEDKKEEINIFDIFYKPK
jgi:superfamily II DNA or RNA helicase